MRTPVTLTILYLLIHSSLQSEDLGIFGPEMVSFAWLHVLNVLRAARERHAAIFAAKDSSDGDDLSALISLCNAALLSKKVDLSRVKSNSNRVVAFRKVLAEKDFGLPRGAMLYHSNGCVFVCRRKRIRSGEDKHGGVVKLNFSDLNSQHLLFANSDILNLILSQIYGEWPVLQLVCKQLYFHCHPRASQDAGTLSQTHPKTSAKAFPIPSRPSMN